MNAQSPSPSRLAAITGATGYIGGRLVPRLLADGWRVRVLTRDAARLASRSWAHEVEVVEGDGADPSTLATLLDGAQVAWYLVHSMDGKGDFAGRDRRLAQTFAAAADAAGVGRIVYLSGLHPAGELSAHLASRVEVGEVFLQAPVPAAVLQAGVVLGDGSASFDMLRHLVERLPAMIAPKWVHNMIQPIAVDDAVHYLAAAAELAPELNRTFDIAGPDVLTYGQMMRGYARAARLGPRLIVSVPVLTPWLASHWVGVVTPVPAGVAKPLVGSLVHDAVADESDLATLVGEPPGGAAGFDEAVKRALTGVDARRWQRTAARTAAMVFGCAVAGGLATDPAGRWYQNLRKPAWQPPSWLFGPVWTALYSGIVLTSTRTLTDLEDAGKVDERTHYQRALIANLVLNASWSATFFRARRLAPATAHAAVLAASSADLARRADAAGRGKAVSLLPYAAWCAFATALTAAVWRRNR